jgi:thioredoxin-like negative regulator of GroEL
VKVDVDIAEDAALYYKVQAMPTFKVMDANGKEVAGVVGGGPGNVENMIQQALKKKK